MFPQLYKSQSSDPNPNPRKKNRIRQNDTYPSDPDLPHWCCVTTTKWWSCNVKNFYRYSKYSLKHLPDIIYITNSNPQCLNVKTFLVLHTVLSNKLKKNILICRHFAEWQIQNSNPNPDSMQARRQVFSWEILVIFPKNVCCCFSSIRKKKKLFVSIDPQILFTFVENK